MKKIYQTTFLLLLAGIFASNQAQIITTFAGTGTAGFSGNGGVATAAKLNNPTGIAFDRYGNTYISDYSNHQIRKVDASGIITTVAGTGVGGFSGDAGLATNAKLNLPSTLTFDNLGNMYIVDAGNGAIRKVTTAGIISTVVGTGVNGYSGDGGAATSAKLNFPCGIYIDSNGDIYIADRNNHRIRKVNTSGIISTYAGTGTSGFSGDGAAAISAKLDMPNGITFDLSGTAYIADAYNNRIRIVNTSGIISTVAGTGTAGSTGDGGAALNAQLNKPFGVTFDAAGNYYVADFSNQKVRKISVNGFITTFAGTGVGGYSGDGGMATNAKLLYFEKVSIDSIGNMYIPDSGNNRVRKISCTQPTVTAITSNSAICAGDAASLTSTGASSYTWSSGNSGANISVSPTVTTTYTVTGTNTLTGCRNSATVTQVVNPCTGVKEFGSKNEFSIYPNPLRHKVTLITNGSKQLVQIFNYLGALVYSVTIENEKTEIDFTNQACGVYFIRVGNTSRKLIKE
ncbi:MAG: T9SS type A sorting domain-containing protein [Bacteroidota bacterium]